MICARKPLMRPKLCVNAPVDPSNATDGKERGITLVHLFILGTAS